MRFLNIFFTPVSGKNAPGKELENPFWYNALGRILIAISLLFIPLLYDHRVPEVAGDIRWMAVHLLGAGLLFLFFLSKTISCTEKSRLPSFRLDWPLAGWLTAFLALWAIVSCIDTYHPYRSWFFLKHFLAYLLVFAFVFQLRQPRFYQVLAWVLALPVFINGILVVCQFNGIHDPDIARPFGALGHWFTKHIFSVDYFQQSAPPGASLANKNLVGSWLALTLPFVVYLFLGAKKRWVAVFSSVLLGLGLTSLLYTRARASWVAMACAVIFFFLWLTFNGNYRRHVQNQFLNMSFIKPILLVLVLGITLGASLFDAKTRGHSMDTTVAEQAQSIVNFTESELGPRIAYNINGIKMTLDHPINGVGIGAFHTTYPWYHDVWYKTPPHGYSVAARPQRAHNDAMQAFIEMGLPGGLALLGLFFTTVGMGFLLSKSSAVKAAEKEGQTLLPLFATTGVVGLGVNSLMDFPLQMPTAPILLYVVVGMITGLYVMYAKGVRFKLAKIPAVINMPVWAVGVMSLVSLALFWGILYDNLQRRQSQIPLKTAMAYTLHGKFNDRNLKALEAAYEAYPWDNRLLEFRGVGFNNHNGKKKVSLDKKIAAMEEAVQYDQYAANNLVNLGGAYYQKAIRFDQLGQPERAKPYGEKILKIHEKLMRSAPFTPHTWSLGGLAYLIKDEPNKALVLFDEALKRSSKYEPAKVGRKFALAKMMNQGKSKEYIEAVSGKNKDFKVFIPLDAFSQPKK